MVVNRCKNTKDKKSVHDQYSAIEAGKARSVGGHKGSFDQFMFVPFGFHIIESVFSASIL